RVLIRVFAFVPPIAIYMRVVLFLILPVSIAVARIPGVVIAALDVAFAYLVGRRVFRRETLAIVAALFVLVTPTHFIHARLGGDHGFAIPFLPLFLLFLITYVEEHSAGLKADPCGVARAPDEGRAGERSLLAATACLGLGVYGYNGAMIAMPVFLALTWGLLFVLAGER